MALFSVRTKTILEPTMEMVKERLSNSAADKALAGLGFIQGITYDQFLSL